MVTKCPVDAIMKHPGIYQCFFLNWTIYLASNRILSEYKKTYCTKMLKKLLFPHQALPSLTGQTRQFEWCSTSRVQPVVGRALSSQSKSQLVGQICPTGPGWSCATGPRNWLDRPVRPAGRCFGWTVPVRPPVKHGCLRTAQTAVFDLLMPAVRWTYFWFQKSTLPLNLLNVQRNCLWSGWNQFDFNNTNTGS
jgi:hypothetical protein